MIPWRNESRNGIKTQKSATFAKKVENEHSNDKICRKGKKHCHYGAKYRGAASSICNLK